MFGMSFGNSVQETSREAGAANQEVADSLIESGFINDEKALGGEDYTAIKTRADIIESSAHVHPDVAIAFAYVDRMIGKDKEAGNTGEAVIAKVTPELVSTLITPSLAGNMEFAATVLNMARIKYANGAPTFFDAVLAAAHEREAAIISTPTLDGKIDGQDNVVQPADEQVLH